MDRLIDIMDSSIVQTLEILLKDNSTGKNIIWATEPPGELPSDCTERHPITKVQLLCAESDVIVPRMMKGSEHQQERTKKKGEVFTPAWICCLMNNHLDAEWFKRSDGLFFSMEDREWTVNPEKIEFYKGRSWKAYVDTRRLEVCCGEAPFLVSRYDASTGEMIPIERRVGILDRKLRTINENVNDIESWTEWAIRAFQSVYGFEFQGDNLLLARLNLMLTFSEYFENRWEEKPSSDILSTIATIISWNLWQMDGLTNSIPFRKPYAQYEQLSLFDFMEEAKEKKEEDVSTPCIIRNWRTGRKIEFVQLKEGNKQMKFDFVIGNPPYQDETLGENKGFAPPVYDKFLTEAYKISDKVEMIHPARFLFNAGSTPKKWNEKMLSDPHLKVLSYEQDGSKIFPNTDIKGGIAITYHDKNQEFGAIQHFVVFDELRSILNKTSPFPKKENGIDKIAYASEAYKFTEKMHLDHPECAGLLSNGHKYDLKSSVFDSLDDVVFFSEIPIDTDKYVRVFGISHGNRAYRWIKKEYIVGPENFEHYKVFIPKANGSGALGEVLSTPLVGQPMIGHTQSFLSIGNCQEESEAINLLKYIKSKFCRVLLGVLKVTQDNPKSVWRLIPIQNFTSSSDIVWTKPIAEIDQQLYHKYGLDQNEIDFIETHVKEMN